MTKINSDDGCALCEKMLLLTVILLSIVTGKVIKADVMCA